MATGWPGLEAVIFVGIQASGKTKFYGERFFDTHIRLSLDMLKTRHREKLLLEACIRAKQPFVLEGLGRTLSRITGFLVAPDTQNRASQTSAMTGSSVHELGRYDLPSRVFVIPC